jgi:hypothetical protein
MSEIVFYRQTRVDGAVRTGLSINGSTALERFETGADEFDPVLLWFVDIRCKGAQLPCEPEEARQWLIANTAWIIKGLDEVAEELSVGIDIDLPFERVLTGSPNKIRAVVVGAAMRRFEAKQIATEIGSIRRHWKRLLASLEPVGV